MENQKLDYYTILELNPEASQEEITKRFTFFYNNYADSFEEKKGSEHHRNELEEFREKLIAYLVLSNPTWKKLYQENPALVEEPYYFYNCLQIALKVFS